MNLDRQDLYHRTFWLTPDLRDRLLAVRFVPMISEVWCASMCVANFCRWRPAPSPGTGPLRVPRIHPPFMFASRTGEGDFLSWKACGNGTVSSLPSCVEADGSRRNIRSEKYVRLHLIVRRERRFLQYFCLCDKNSWFEPQQEFLHGRFCGSLSQAYEGRCHPDRDMFERRFVGGTPISCRSAVGLKSPAHESCMSVFAD